MPTKDLSLTDKVEAGLCYPAISIGISSFVAETINRRTHEALRNLLPEPWDIGDHIGNVGLSALFGLGAYALGRVLETKASRLRTPLARMVLMASCGLGVGVGVNAVAEHSSVLCVVGAPFGYQRAVDDRLDMVYGILTAEGITLQAALGREVYLRRRRQQLSITTSKKEES